MDAIATVTHIVEAKFDGKTGSGHTVRIEGGNHDTGPSPMELVLVALGGCSAVTVVEFLEKMRQPIASLEVEVSGERAEDSPRVYTKIHARYLVGGDVDRGRVQRAIELTESKYCSVHTMLAQTAAMTHTIEFVS
jgi:putative redox protein